MHPSVRRALEEIDAAVMNGDTFSAPAEDDERDPKQQAQAYLDRKEILQYLAAWWRELTLEPEGSELPSLDDAFQDLSEAAEAIDRRTGSSPAEEKELRRAALRYAAVELERHPISLDELPGHAAALHLKSKGGAL